MLWGEIELKKGNICCGTAGEVVITLKRLVRVHLLEMNGRSLQSRCLGKHVAAEGMVLQSLKAGLCSRV